MNSTQSTTLRDARYLLKHCKLILDRHGSMSLIKEVDDFLAATDRAALAAADATDQGQDDCRRCRSYATLVKAKESQLAHVQAEAEKGREANAMLTAELAARPAPIGAVAPDAILAACYRVDWSSNEPAGAILLAAMKDEIADLRAALKAAAPAAPIAEVTDADKFCDAHCCWSGHHKDCVRADPDATPSPLLDTIERSAWLTDFAATNKAQAMYRAMVDSSGVHENRMPGWGELSADEQNGWKHQARQFLATSSAAKGANDGN